MQQQRVEELGEWLEINGHAIFVTQPWVTAEAKTQDAIPIRFTQKGDFVYAIVLGALPKKDITFDFVQIAENTNIELLGCDSPLSWQQQGITLTVTLPDMVQPTPAHTLKISIEHR